MHTRGYNEKGYYIKAPFAPSLKTLKSLNREVGPFFLGDTSIWGLPSVSSLSDYSI